MKNAVIFDMDGTLFQTDKILEISLVDTFDKLRMKDLWIGLTPIDKYKQIMGVPLPVVWENLLPDHSDEVRIYANDIFHQKLVENIEVGNGGLYPNVIEIFEFLSKKNIPIFIASNGLTEYLNAIIKFYQLNHWLMDVYSIQQIESLDKTELVKNIIETHSIEDGIVVGDRLSDFNAAKENALLAVGCKFDFAQEEELIEADIIIDNLILLKEIIEERYKHNLIANP
ncbi:HAD hydrolase-like protein [Bacillus sp. EAC]|uniref:HAD hydrolase-like protein n=1 Tax=Bacillus sp. EAC TaxID=1978338 RepID=UPI000B44C2E4|nr:HAD hydrolase-like protein [Bacillus sp. EAC]